jgi:CO/xanthine dehydrogenase FAD-binding subunit
VQPFDYVVPGDHAEASAMLATGSGAARPYQGGTDLLIRIRGGFVQPEFLVDLKGLPGMREIRESADGWMVIGAACTMNGVAVNRLAQARHDLLVQACNSVASISPAIARSLAATAATPARRGYGPTDCLGAQAEVFGPTGAPPSSGSFSRDRRHHCGAGILDESAPPPVTFWAPWRLQQIRKDENRRHFDCSVAVAAARRRRREPVADRSSAVGPTPLRCAGSEAILEKATSGAIEAAATAAAAQLAIRRYPGQRATGGQ